MSKFTFENQGVNTYLVYQVGEDTIDEISLGMITNNKIPGLAVLSFSQIDEDKYIKYNITGKIPAKEILKNKVNKKRLIGLFHSVVSVLLSIEDYMLNINSIMLDADYIFCDVSSGEASLICIPVVVNHEKNINHEMFFKSIMMNTQFDQSENSAHILPIMNFLNSEAAFSLAEFKILLEDIKNGKTNQPKDEEVLSKTIIEGKEAKEQGQVKKNSIAPPTTPPTAPPITPPITPPTVKKGESVPSKPISQIPPNVPKSVPSLENQKQKTFFWLLSNYSKENKRLYKEQKEAKKHNAMSGNIKPPISSTGVNIPNSGGGYAIPGKKVSIGESINSPISTNKPGIEGNAPSTIHMIEEKEGQNFGETTVLGGAEIGETTVLTNAQVQNSKSVTPYLIRLKNREKIEITKNIFRIGKERSFVDYFVGDNTAISRSHANIVVRDGVYFIIDTNSKNHTFVNGSMIQSNTEVKIEHGAKICLADEEFEFHLY